jgi:hypothetical protein
MIWHILRRHWRHWRLVRRIVIVIRRIRIWRTVLIWIWCRMADLRYLMSLSNYSTFLFRLCLFDRTRDLTLITLRLTFLLTLLIFTRFIRYFVLCLIFLLFILGNGTFLSIGYLIFLSLTFEHCFDNVYFIIEFSLVH